MNKFFLTTNAILMIIITIISIFFFKQCQSSSSKTAEIARLENNVKAANDTIKTYVNKNGELVTEIRGYIFDSKKDKKQIQSLVGENESLKGIIAAGTGHGGSTSGGTIPTTVIQNSDLTGLIKLADSTIYNKTNYNKFSASTPYKLYTTKTLTVKDKDSTYTVTPVLQVNNSTYSSEVALDLSFRFQEEKAGQLKVIVETPNKSVKFSSLKGVVLTGDDLPADIRMTARKEWGIGFSGGIGLGYDVFNKNLIPVVYLGIGINYSPKKIQF